MSEPLILGASEASKVSAVQEGNVWKSVFSNPVGSETVALERSIEKDSIDLKNVPGGSCLQTLKKVGLLGVNVAALPFRLVFGTVAIALAKVGTALTDECPVLAFLCIPYNFVCDMSKFLCNVDPEDVFFPVSGTGDEQRRGLKMGAQLSIWNKDGAYGTLPAIADSFSLLFRKDLTMDTGRAVLRAEYLISNSKDPIIIAVKRDDKECFQELLKKKPTLILSSSLLQKKRNGSFRISRQVSTDVIQSSGS